MPKITIEKELYEQVKKVAEEAGYSSVEEFVTHVIEREVNPPGADDRDEDMLNRLKGLGYIA
jgi:metal-responsive CopG/Arc/MetJ family transcriptional regulator